MTTRKVLIVGAGVIGRIYAGRLAKHGHDVTVLARGATAIRLAADGITLREGSDTQTVRVRVIDAVDAENYDFIVIAVRRDQSAAAIEAAARATGGPVVPMFNNPLGLGSLRQRFGADRVIGAFPGVGGYLEADGTVRYLSIRQQPTTVARNAGREAVVVQALKDAEFAVSVVEDFDGWLATHGVFVVTLAAALEHAGYSVQRLTGDRAAMREMVRAVRGGFAVLASQGINVSPTGLRVIFTRVPVALSARYWSRALRGPLGSVAIAPHTRATRDTEMSVLRADISELIPPGRNPDFDRVVGRVR